MTKSFDEWFKKTMPNTHKGVGKEKIETFVYETAQDAWNFKQAEIDELRKRIDEINKLVDLWREDYITLVKYDDGNRYCLEDCINRVVNILEGNTNES